MNISAKARPFYASMVNDLLTFYQREGQFMTDTQLFVQVSLRFGDRMLTEVCGHLDLEIGECSIGAIEIMREAYERIQHGKEQSQEGVVDGG